jgi:hypothetical protein
MKKSISTQQQSNVWFRKNTDKYHVLRLRRNHETFERETVEGVETLWRCDEIEITVPLRNDIEQYVETNFDALFDAWLLLEGMGA